MFLILSIGSNCGNREKAVEDAIIWLSEKLNGIKSSPVYETACACKSGRPYMNAVVVGTTNLSLKDFDFILKGYELSYGRDASCRERGDVPIDIDIVVADGTVLRSWDYRQRFFTLGLEFLEK